MIDKPLVTILTPLYNNKEYISETIDSVLNQDYSSIDYIVIDDASTDGFDLVPEEVRNYTLKKHKVNMGEQVTVNEGLQLVKGKYFMIVNADDPLLPNAVSTLVKVMEQHPRVLCAYPDWNSIGEDGKVRRQVKCREYDFQWMVAHHTWLPSVGSMFRSTLNELIGYRDTRLQWLGDADYWLRVGFVGGMTHVSVTLACWRNHTGQASAQKSSRRAQEHIKVIEKFYNRPDMPQYLLDIKTEAVCWSHLVAAVVTNSRVDIIKYLATVIKLSPKFMFSRYLWDILLKRVWYILRR